MSATKVLGEKRSTSDDDVHFFGEEKCSTDGCRFNAYYRLAGGALICGVHSRNKPRTELPKNPDAKERTLNTYTKWEEEVQLAAKANRDAGRKGSLTVAKLQMMKLPDHKTGVRNVFPNYKHQNRSDGFGCSSLSPMLLGPVQHEQPGVPDSLTIENYHQFNKVFERDVVHKADGSVELKPSFVEVRDRAYLDSVGHRHKYPGDKGVGGNRNIPLFSYHVAKSGQGRRYTYAQSRYFYCHQYELLAKQKPDFHTLRDWLDHGYNLQIVGYDGNPVATRDNIWALYNDTVRPFGHELVLFALLVIDDPKQYPWNRFYEENKKLYE